MTLDYRTVWEAYRELGGYADRESETKIERLVTRHGNGRCDTALAMLKNRRDKGQLDRLNTTLLNALVNDLAAIFPAHPPRLLKFVQDHDVRYPNYLKRVAKDWKQCSEPRTKAERTKEDRERLVRNYLKHIRNRPGYRERHEVSQGFTNDHRGGVNAG